MLSVARIATHNFRTCSQITVRRQRQHSQTTTRATAMIHTHRKSIVGCVVSFGMPKRNCAIRHCRQKTKAKSTVDWGSIIIMMLGFTRPLFDENLFHSQFSACCTAHHHRGLRGTACAMRQALHAAGNKGDTHRRLATGSSTQYATRDATHPTSLAMLSFFRIRPIALLFANLQCFQPAHNSTKIVKHTLLRRKPSLRSCNATYTGWEVGING